MLRHNAASMMVQNCVPLTTIAAILGHAETRTTDTYVTADINNLKECVLPLDTPNPYISIIGKGRKRRNVPIMKKTVAHLNSYLKEFHPSEQPVPLFYSMRDGKPHRLSTDSISLVVGTAAKTARETCNAVPENVHCHLFRKTKAMDLYKSGVPLPFIMQLLGHESMSTTSGFYAFATLEMMSEAINKSAPSISGNEKLWKSKDAKRFLYTLD